MAKVELKAPIVAEIAETVKDAKAVMLVQYLGLTVEQDTELRKKLRENGVIYKVYKNTLMNRAFQGTENEPLTKDLEGPNALVVSKEDATAPARLLADYDKKIKCFNMVSGMIDGEYADAAKLAEVSKIPSKEVLLGRLFGSMQSPITNFARVLKQIAEKDGEAAPAAEEAPAAE
ncbi:MAG: 50S ribosomal protein L10 [Lachnospiraceae bacterium]|nr:50S ribosomal protein L10 [Candidatus Equihabitans merdae]